MRSPVMIGAGVRGPAEIAWSKDRPAAHRPPPPIPGLAVLYRSNDWFDPVPAVIVQVFWYGENGIDNRRNLRIPDPWPMVRLHVPAVVPAEKLDADGTLLPGSAIPRPTIVDTWESRLDGSAGWLPLDWPLWPRPPAGEIT